MLVHSAILLLILTGCGPGAGKDSTSSTENSAPSSPSIVVSPASAATDEDLVVVFTAESSDPDGDTITYRYLWAVDGTVRTDLTTDTVSASETTKGESWTVTVTPSDGDVDGDPVTADAVIVNTLPVATVTLDPQGPGVTEDVTASATATDLDADAVSFTYAWTVDGETSEYTDEVLPAGAAVRGETWTVTAIPSDDEEAGEGVDASITFENSVPTVTSVAITPAVATEADTLVATTEGATDADADSVTFVYGWYVDGALVQEGASASLGPEFFAKNQTVEVEATPNDGLADGEPVRSVAVSIGNSLPSISGVTIDPKPAYESSTLTCLPAGYFDIDGDTGAYGYEWTVDGSTVASTATIDGSLFGKGASVACSATPNDGEADGSAVWSDALTVSNTAPTLGVASLTNRTPTEADSVAVTLAGESDDDGDSIAYAYNWYVNGALAATTSTIDGAHFDKGDSVQVEVLPWDGTEYGAAVWSDTAVAVNSAPTVTTASLTPASAYTDDVLTASVATSDADGDSVSVGYTWYVNGVPISATGSTLDGDLHFDKADEVYVLATPDDGGDSGTGLYSSAITILNSPPTAPVIAVSPSDPEDADELVCDVVSPSTDADGDSVSYTYSWEVDGSDAGTSSDTVPAASTSAGDAWTCAVFAGDGDDVSAEATDSVSIGGCYALDFDGTNDYVLVPASGDFTYGSSFSAEAWVYAASGASYQRIAGHDHNYAWHLDLESSNTVRFQLNDTASQQATATLSLGSWHHVAGVLSGGSLYLYVDGVLAGTGTGTSPGSAYTGRDVSLGGDSYWTGDYPWAGMIGPTRISSNARYSGTFTPEWGWTDDSNTLALWNFGEATGTTLGDSSGNGNDGTVVGATWASVVCP